MRNPVRPWGQRRWSWILWATVVVAGIGGGASAWALTAGSGPAYRTAVVGRDTVQQTLDTTGTLQPVTEASLSFQVAGQVANVDVTTGQQVTAGQTVATLDTTTLTADVAAAQATVNADQTKLADDEQSETTAASATTTSTSTPSGGAPGGSSETLRITQDLQTLLADQQQADTDSAHVAADLRTATSTCPSAGGGGPGSGGTGTGSGSGTGTGSGTGGTGAMSIAQCTAALEQVLADQQRVASDEQHVADDENALAKLLDDASGAVPGTSGSSGHPPSPSSGAAPSVASPEQVAADQATLDAAQAQLSDAQQVLDEAQLITPISGTVASVTMAAGQSVSAGSTSARVVVVAPQAFEVQATVSVADIAMVHTGDTAMVTPDGSTSPLTGTVTAIGLLPTASSSSSAAYPVTIALAQGQPNLLTGANASVSIVVGTAVDAVTVPTSAVHTTGAVHLVTVLSGGHATPTRVMLGVVGADLTQVTSGLEPGQVVVLADLATPLPTSTTPLRLFGGGGPRVFGGGGSGGPSGSSGP